MSRVEMKPGGILLVMQSPTVRTALRKRAEAIAARANGEDAELRARVQEGTRPKGRPFARAISETGAAKEWGTDKTARRRTLGRAAGI
jgi:hypothetical protein